MIMIIIMIVIIIIPSPARKTKYPLPSYDQPCCVSEEPGAREEQPIYLTLTLHRKVRKPEFK